MSVVKINAIEVTPERGPELEERFRQRASEVESMPGFEGFELLRPVAGETRYFVYTRWATEEDFQAWVSSSAFTRGHAQATADKGERPVSSHASLLAFEVVLSASPTTIA
jgi:heme-degrading monooxygenase HmoA